MDLCSQEQFYWMIYLIIDLANIIAVDDIHLNGGKLLWNILKSLHLGLRKNSGASSGQPLVVNDERRW